jgi:CBS domain-containing protein
MRTINPQLFVAASVTLESAKELMKDNGTGSLVVVNNQGELIGFLQGGKITRRSEKSLSKSTRRS